MARVYVCGFLFSPDRSAVALIRKRRPAWQAGRLNGVGGKVESGESPEEAMAREFREEAGVEVRGWREVVVLEGRPSEFDPAGWRGHFFAATASPEAWAGVRSMTDEAIEKCAVRPLPGDTIPNLGWIIPLMLDEDHAAARAYTVRVVSPGVA